MVSGSSIRKISYDMDQKPPKVKIYHKTKHPNNCSRCQCLICGAILSALTIPHAVNHGYDSKQSMIDAGKVKWL